MDGVCNPKPNGAYCLTQIPIAIPFVDTPDILEMTQGFKLYVLKFIPIFYQSTTGIVIFALDNKLPPRLISPVVGFLPDFATQSQ